MRHYKLKYDLRVIDCFSTDQIILPKGTPIGIHMKFGTYAECYCLQLTHRHQPDYFLVSYNEMESL